MKKILALLLAVALVACLFAGCQPSGKPGDKPSDAKYRVAMVTDYGDITDQSFNQTTYEACKAYCEANKIDFEYFKPTDDSTEARVAMIDNAIAKNYNVIVLPGFAFAGAIYEVQDKNPDTKFVALDVSEFDVFDCFYNHDKDGNRTDLIDAKNEPHVSNNVYCAVYQEELAGYMAGYAAVKLGYKHLGFLGGMAVPAVVRYGYGFVQGADKAAAELGISKDITIEYVYGGAFSGDADITAVMDTWYAKDTEVVFACGGGIFTSAAEAAQKAGGKVIGVDVDQAAIINKYGEGMTVTSAMKGLAATVKHVLTETIENDKWSTFGGKIETLGLVSGDDPEANYVQIPMESTQWSDSFSKDDYKALVKSLFDGTLKVSSDTEKMPTVTVTVNEQGTIKG